MPKGIDKSIVSLIMESINNSDIGICICEVEGAILYVNDNCYDIFNSKKTFRTTDELLGKNICELIPYYRNLFEKVIRERTIKKYEIVLDCEERNINHEADNDVVITWLYNDAYVTATDSGEYIVIIIQDHSFLKKVELDLLKYERKLTSIIETIPDVVYRVNPDGIITFISDAIIEYGYTPEELIGTNILELVHPEDKDKAGYVLKERRTGERKTLAFEVRLLTKKGNVEFEFEDQFITDSKFFLVSSEGIYVPKYEKGNSFIGTQGVARDVTSKRYADLILKKTDERWRSVLDSINDGYYESDAKGNFIYINKALADMFGYDAGEIIGRNYEDFVEQNNDKIFHNSNDNSIGLSDDVKLVDWIIIRKDGKKRFVEASVNTIYDTKGNSSGFRGIIRDITDKHKLEKEILRYRKLEAIGILAGGIAHDYNNALTAILGNISLAKMEVDPSNRNLREVLDDAETASMRIMELTRRLSDFAQGGRPDRKVISIENMIRETVDSAMHGYKKEYELHIQDNLWKVDIDSDQVSHAVELIIQNAKESMSNNGKISILAINKSVDEEITRYEMSLQTDDYVMLEIKDEGTGIDSDVIDRIFDPYFTTKDFASGMGLAISYAIIKRHHGYIGVESEPCKGTTFRIYIPSASV